MAAYGFVAALPLPLSGFTLRLWLSEGGVSLGLIGLTANIGLAYSLKFLWSPILDNASPPGLLRRLGRRRGWLATIQPALTAAAALLALSDPARLPFVSLALAALVAFLLRQPGYRRGRLAHRFLCPAPSGRRDGRLHLGLSRSTADRDHRRDPAVSVVGWHVALLGVAALIACGLIVTLMAPEPPPTERPVLATRFGSRLAHAVIAPLRDFLARRGAALILAFVALFKLGGPWPAS